MATRRVDPTLPLFDLFRPVTYELLLNRCNFFSLYKYNPDWASQIFKSFRLESFVFERGLATFVEKITLLIKISGISGKYGTNIKKLVEFTEVFRDGTKISIIKGTDIL